MTLLLPWTHRLPDYARMYPGYGQNLVWLAQALAAPGASLKMLDVGANVGDSALQVIDAVAGAEVLCVEADNYYLSFLQTNVGPHDRVVVVRALLAATHGDVAMAPVRSGGTTRFEPGSDPSTASSITPADLRAGHPRFDELRLIKSDTDGHDVILVPAIARAWSDQRPVIFMEFDPELSVLHGHDPNLVWDELAEMGYERVAVWDNLGAPLGSWNVVEAADRFAETAGGARKYWDVAVAHADDLAGKEALVAALARH